MRYWPKCLTYGNWGGPSWSGGIFTNNPKEVNWDVQPIDEMDAFFKEHDFNIQHNLGRLSHKILAKQLDEFDPPKHWTTWQRLYRLAAIGIFRVLSVGV
jgi:hypothetical protein